MIHSKRCARPAWPTMLAVMFTMGLGLAGGPAWAQDAKPQPKAQPRPAPKPADPKAQALLNEVAKAYKALGSYSDEGKFVVAMTLAGKPQNQIDSPQADVRPSQQAGSRCRPRAADQRRQNPDHGGHSPQAVHHGALARKHQSRHVSPGTDGRGPLWRTHRRSHVRAPEPADRARRGRGSWPSSAVRFSLPRTPPRPANPQLPRS